MATKQEPIRRNDVIRCEKCGEDYSITYKRCPFCDERPARAGTTPGGRRVAGGGQGGYGAGRVNPLQVGGLVVSLALIITALYIVVTNIGPLFSQKDPLPGSQSSQSSVSTSQSDPGGSSADPSGSGDVSTPDPVPPVVTVNSIALDKTEFTLKRGETYHFTVTADPADAQVTWTSSDENIATVSADGTVTNVNAGTSQVTVTITATAGDKTAQCTVYCRAGSTGTTAPSGGSKTGTISGADLGLNVRTGPGSSNEPIASLQNGTSVNILEDTGSGWYKISFVGLGGKLTEGYVSKDYVTVG